MKERKFVILTTAGGRTSTWPRIWLTVAAVAAGAVLLWLGLVLALAVILAATCAFLPVWAWRLFTANRRPGGPATIEGEYTMTTLSSVEAGDEARGRNPTRDAEREY